MPSWPTTVPSFASIALSATRWEAARQPVQEAVRTGLVPFLNSTTVVGIVSLPGMMTGEVLAGPARAWLGDLALADGHVDFLAGLGDFLSQALVLALELA